MQEDIYHQDNQDDGFDQRLHHLVDGSVQKLLDAHHVHQFQAFRQFRAYLLHQLVYLLNDFVGVRAGRLRYHGRGAGVAVHFAAVRVALRAQLYAGDVA